jgi:hypothetical protein
LSLPLAVVPPGNTADVGTIGTIISSNVTLSGTITVGSVSAVNYFTGTVSATIKASKGNLWGFAVANPSGVTTGMRLLNYEAGLSGATASIIAEAVVPSFDFRSRDFSRPVSFGTLIASILGTIVYTVLYE